MKSLATEREIQKAILCYLELEHCFAIRLNTGSGWQNGRPIQSHSGGKGVADILAIRPTAEPCTKKGCNWLNRYEQVIWIEVKTGKGKQTPEQRNFAEHVTSRGMYYILARSLDDVREWVKEHR